MNRKIFRLWAATLLLMILSSTALGAGPVDWELLNTLKLNTPPLDVAISPDGKMVFVLTGNGSIYVYEDTGRLAAKIDVGEPIDQIRLDPNGERLFATNRQNKTVKVIALEFIKQIPTRGSPYKGPENAPIVIAGFSDFE